MTYIDFKGIGRTEFFETIGISPSNFKGVAKQSELGSDKVAKILATYADLSAEWLLLDEGDMIKSMGEGNATTHAQPTPDNEDCKARLATSPTEGIPLIPLNAMAGALTGETSVLEYECDRYVVPMFKGADFLIQVKGSSMYPKYSSGDIVACQRVPMSRLFFQWNKVYVIDTDQGALIKRIKPGSTTEHVLIVSDNEKYDPFELPLTSIHAVALVIGVIRLE